jgi:hypothetical protein
VVREEDTMSQDPNSEAVMHQVRGRIKK